MQTPNATTHLASFFSIETVSSGRTVSAQGRPNLLIVDDQRSSRQLIVKELSADHNCVEAVSVFEALGLMERESFAVVIVDIRLTGIYSVDLLNVISQTYPDTFTIVVSNMNCRYMTPVAMKLAGFDFISKPLTPVPLKTTVQAAIERRQLVLDAHQYIAQLSDDDLDFEGRFVGFDTRVTPPTTIPENDPTFDSLEPIIFELADLPPDDHSCCCLPPDRIRGILRLLSSYDLASLDPITAMEIDVIKREINYEEFRRDIEGMLETSHTLA